MKVLLSALHFAYLRNFEPVVRALAERGHHVHLSADEPERLGGQALVERLAAEYANVTWDFAPSADSEPWYHAASRFRIALDYVRFSDRMYARSPKLRRRYRDRAPRLVRVLLPVVRPSVAKRLLTRLERLMPRVPADDDYFRRHAPDVVMLASLTYARSRQLDHLKSARALGIPTVACIASWDHLSSKALLHLPPDLVIVWNEVQRDEAIRMHGLPANRIVSTGAQCYDHWFGRRPDRSRDELCRAVGLRPDRPFILYVCSALSPTPDPVEPVFVRRWIEALRSHPALRDAGVLVRPHPERRKEWDAVSLEGLDNVVLHGANPIDDEAKRDYFDSLYHSSAVVGLVTSAFLEAAIVGRPVLTVLTPEYRPHQEEMVHFQYLLNVDGGILRTATTLAEHVDHLAQAVREQGRDERNRRFLTTFVRPSGLDTAATPLFADAVERFGRDAARVPDAALSAGTPLHNAVRAAATAMSTTKLGRWLLMDSREIANVRFEKQRLRVRHARLETRAADKRRRMAAWRALKIRNLIKRKLGWTA
jgi:hypothetical protein